MKRLITGLVMAGLIMPHMAVALDARTSMLRYASAGNVQALNGMIQQGYSFEMMDVRGNTPVCEAALRGDQKALNVLVAMGANPQPACWNNLPPQVAMQMQPQPMVAHLNMAETTPIVVESAPATTNTQVSNPVLPRKRVPVYAPTKKAIDWSIPSWVGWVGVAGGVGGAVALIAGSGSSHSTGNDKHKCDGYTLVLQPANASYESCEVNGQKRYKIISCSAGYVLANGTCSAKGCSAYTLTTCPKRGTCAECTEVTGEVKLKLTSCSEGYSVSGNNCVYSGCSAYPLTKCPAHGSCSDCQNPEDGTKTYKLDACDPEYTISNNACVRNSGTKQADKIGRNSATKGDLKSDEQSNITYLYPAGTIEVDSAVYQDVYGIKSAENKQVNNAYTSASVKSPGSVTIQILDLKDGHVYGIYAMDSSKKGTAVNARSVGGETTTKGSIDISKNNSAGLINSHVYGLYSGTSINAYLYGIKDKAANDTRGDIKITKSNNQDNTVLAGVYGATWAANSIKAGYGGIHAYGNIELSHSGSGNVYGVQGVAYAYNAAAVPSVSDSNLAGDTHGEGYLLGVADGKILIKTTWGTANVYGVYGTGRVANGWRDGAGKDDGYNDHGTVRSHITINNKGDGTIAGVYSTGAIAKSAFNYYGYHGTEATVAIKITSTGSGKVYGLKSDSLVAHNAYTVFTGIRKIETSTNKDSEGNNYTNATVADVMIKLGDTTKNDKEETIPSSALVSDNDAYGMYNSTSARNAYMLTEAIAKEESGADKDAVQKVITNGKIYVFHQTPTTGSADKTINITGMRIAGNSYNAAGDIGTNVRSTGVNGNIEVRELHLSDGKANAKGVEFVGGQNHTFYNAYFVSAGSIENQKGKVSGSIYVNGQTGCTNGTVNAYGITASGDVYNAYSDNTTTGGSATGSIVVRGKDVAYGIWLNDGYVGSNASAQDSGATVTGKITATTSTGAVAGMRTNSGIFYNARSGGIGSILVSATGASNKNNAYGMYSGDGALYNAHGTTSKGTIDVLYRGTGKGIGMYGNAVNSGAGTSVINVTLVPGLVTESGVLKAKGDAIGMYAISGYAVNGTEKTSDESAATTEARKNTIIKVNSIGPLYTTTDNAASNSTAVAVENDTSRAIGMYAKKGATITNNAKIEIVREDYAQRPNAGGDVTRTWKPATSGNSTGRAIGMYHEGGGGTVNNNGNITVTGSIQDVVSHNNYGIYVQDGTNTTVNNTGTIHVGANGYGIYIASNGSKATITNSNTGKIMIGYTEGSIKECTGDACKSTPGAIVRYEEASAPILTSQYIYLGGGTLTNESLITAATPIDFDDMGGQAAISTGGTYEAPSLKGSLFVSNEVTQDSFDTTYTLHDALKADDVSEVTVKSKSALFTANKDSNGSDITLSMKKFTDFENSSVAQFFDKNYALKQNAKLFNILKKAGSTKELRAQMKSLTGHNMFGRMNFEDMSVLKELNFSMNHNLFAKKMQSFKLVDNVTPSLVRGGKNANIRYSLMNRQMGNKSVGVGIAFIDTHNADSHDENTRTQSMYQMVVPFGYTKNKVSMVMAPRLGYARGSYDRNGFGKTYDGKIEKRMYGVTNEARYDFKLGDWTLAPAVEFNVMGYQQKGHEDKKEFSLSIPTQNTLSVESGVGFYASNEQKLSHGTLNLNAGVMAYHEFADPYRLDVRMNEMQGHYTISDENHGANRALLRAGFDYKTKDLDIYGNIISEFSKDMNTSAKTGVKINF